LTEQVTHILHAVGARPNFMKLAPVRTALAALPGVRQTIVHTGQHYDYSMSEVFFRQLGIPAPDLNLEVGSGTHAWQTAQIMMRFEQVLLAQKPDLVLVYGDVNSTVAAALVCAKLLVPIGHVEAGLRSFDRTMPEEINRLLTDQVADFLFTPSDDGDENLLREGVSSEKIFRVGNVMIDTLMGLLPAAEKSPILDQLGLGKSPKGDAARPPQGTVSQNTRQTSDSPYGLVTLHRPSSVDEPGTLSSIIEALEDVARHVRVIFPVHPRTRERLDAQTMRPQAPGLQLLDPLGTVEFLALERYATFVITDSGGIQEETTCLGVPCLTVRKNTERPITIAMGTNILVGHDMDRLRAEVSRILAGESKKGQVPPLWDGHTAERIAAIVKASLADRTRLSETGSREKADMRENRHGE
jgi:UDP-N-acetylglucosamine 2-epimerase (non-hydrolysing)